MNGEDGDVQQKILDGTYELDDDFPLEAKYLIEQIQRPQELKVGIPDDTTVEDFRQYIKNIKERTSPSPSGRHYGRYKILNNMHPNYLKVIHGILQMILSKCIILDQWKEENYYITGKKEGNPFIHKFRAIHIVEGDLQFIARYFYVYKMMKCRKIMDSYLMNNMAAAKTGWLRAYC